MNKKIYHSVAWAVLSLLTIVMGSCADDEYTSRGDLFQPRFATSPVVTVTNHNDASCVWYESNDAVSYTVQLFLDYYYQTKFMEFTTTDPYFKVEDIPYGTRYYVRVRCNAQDSIHNSQWALTDFTTDPRPDFAQLLQNVMKSDIEDNSAIIRWIVDEANPVDSISVEPAMDKTLPTVARMLTATEQAQGFAKIDGLTPSTLYKVNVYDTHKPRRYDKPYNEVNFRTTGPAPATIEIGLTDDFSAILNANNDDPSVPEGTVYKVPAGSTYTIAPFSIKKGFRVEGPETGDKPILVMNGSWNFASGAYVSTFSFSNVEIRNQKINQYFFNCGNPYTVEEVNFLNVTFRNISRGFWRHQASNNKHIQNITLDGCWFDQCGWQSGSYGTFYFGSAGKNEIATYDQVDNMTINNCTFSRGGHSEDPSWGWGNLLKMSTTSAPINLTIQNVTFYDFCVNSRLIDISNTEKSTVTIRSVIIASPMGELITVGSGTHKNYSNNYSTTDYPLGPSQIQGTALPLSAQDIFENPAGGDYTIKDTKSILYQTEAGDKRWIK